MIFTEFFEAGARVFLGKTSWKKFSPNPFQELLTQKNRMTLGWNCLHSISSEGFVRQKFRAYIVLPCSGLQDLFLSLTASRISSRKFWGPLPLKLTADTFPRVILSGGQSPQSKPEGRLRSRRIYAAHLVHPNP